MHVWYFSSVMLASKCIPAGACSLDPNYGSNNPWVKIEWFDIFAPFKMLRILLLRQVALWTQVNNDNFCNQTVQFYTKQHRRRITDCDVNVMISKITFRKEIFDLRHNFQQRQMKALSGATVNSVLKIFRIICFEFWKSSFFSMLN